MSGMEEFFTRQAANEGIKIPLFLPDGTASKHYLIVRGMDSDEFKYADANSKRSLMKITSAETEDKRKSILLEAEVELIASLVAGWSFDIELTKESVMHFLREAPQIRDEIDKVAGRRSFFLARKLSNSKLTPEKSSSLTKSPRVHGSVSEKASPKSTKPQAKSQSN